MIGLLIASGKSLAAEDRAGMFVRAQDAFTQDLLDLRVDGTYQMSTMSEGPMLTSRGGFKRERNLLTLGGPPARLPAQLLVVDWGTRRYLVEPQGVTSFCEFARRSAGHAAPLFPPMVFYRPMDEGAKFPRKLPTACNRGAT